MSDIHGGPAFPHPVAVGPSGDVYSPHDVCAPGMTLRDWFAGQYLAGNSWSGGTLADLATDAYVAADAMLDERSKGGGT